MKNLTQVLIITVALGLVTLFTQSAQAAINGNKDNKSNLPYALGAGASTNNLAPTSAVTASQDIFINPGISGSGDKFAGIYYRTATNSNTGAWFAGLDHHSTNNGGFKFFYGEDLIRISQAGKMTLLKGGLDLAKGAVSFSNHITRNLVNLHGSGTTAYALGIEGGTMSFQIPTGAVYKFYGNGTARMTLTAAGNLGIGTTAPAAKLHVEGRAFIGNDATSGTSNAGIWLETSSGMTTDWFVGVGASDVFRIHNDADLVFVNNAGDLETLGDVSANGNMSTAGNITANGNITATGTVNAYRVAVTAGTFPDYVFAPDYELMTLSEVEAYINAHHHLPKFPSAKEVIANGQDLGQLNILLTEKVEELTLHTIAQEKAIEALQAELAAIKAMIND